MVTRSEIYAEFIGPARVQSAGGANSQKALEAVQEIRRRAVILGRVEEKAALKAEQLLIKARRIVDDERTSGTPNTTEYQSTIRQYEDQLNELERLIGRRMRGPG